MSGKKVVTKKNPCPACGSPDWCAWFADGGLRCMRPDRAETPAGMIDGGLDRAGGRMFFPKPDDDTGLAERQNRFTGPGIEAHQPERVSPADVEAEYIRLRGQMTGERLQELSRATGVAAEAWAELAPGWASADDLQRLKAGGAGWGDKPPVAAWAFAERNGSGEIVGLSLRAPDGRKGFCKGHSRGLTVPGPSDFAERVRSAACVLVVEGASDVAALGELGLVAVGRPSNRTGADDLAAILNGSPVIVLGECDCKPDGTFPGREGAVAIAEGLAERWGRPVRWALPAAGTKDCRTLLASIKAGALPGFAGMKPSDAGRQLLSELLKRCETALPPEVPPEVLPPEIPQEVFEAGCDDAPGASGGGTSGGDFPLSVLPRSVATFVRESAVAMGCPAAFLAAGCLGTLAGATGGRYLARIKRGFEQPLVLWLGLIGESGSMKSPALGAALQPLRGMQREAWAAHAAAMAEYEQRQAAFESCKRGRRSAVLELGTDEAPAEPVPWRCLADDATLEALAPILKANPHGLLLTADELSGWLLSLNKYNAGRGSDAARYLSMFDGLPLSVDRKSQKPLHVGRACCSIVGGIQPGLLRSVFGATERDSGLLARFLLVWPADRAARWSDGEPPAEAVEGWQALVQRLAAVECGDDAEGGGEGPHVLTLSPGAVSRFAAFHDEAAERIEACGDGHLRSHLSKLRAGILARLAGVLHIADLAEGGLPISGFGLPAVPADTMERACTLALWFEGQARRIYSGLAETEGETERRALVAYIARQPGRSVTIRQLRANMRHRFRTAEQAESALIDLQRAGLGRWASVQNPTGPAYRLFTLGAPGSAPGIAPGSAPGSNAAGTPAAAGPGASGGSGGGWSVIDEF